LLQFASSAVHVIAGPIDQISSLVALFVRRYRGRLDDDADTLLSHFEAAGSRLGSAGTGLRKYLQISTDECGRAPVDMNMVLKAAIESRGKRIVESDAEICADDLPALTGDRDLLLGCGSHAGQIAVNMLEQTVKIWT
jgi:two-component system, chemotaxis family, sensor kinase Cph1